MTQNLISQPRTIHIKVFLNKVKDIAQINSYSILFIHSINKSYKIHSYTSHRNGKYI